MNIVFFGTSEFALPTLRLLSDSRHKVLALVTQPDRKKGRRLKTSPPPAKVLGLAKNIPVYQPQDASSPDAIEYLKRLDVDLFVVVSFGQILKEGVLSIPKLYSINLHGSLLPEYRGAAPTNWAIINGERTSGVTVIRMNERMDEGDIILQREVRIGEEDTNITLSEKLSELGREALSEAIGLIEKSSVTFTKQDSAKASYAPKLKKEDGIIDWSDLALKIHNKVRGLIPWPGAYTHFEGRILKIWETEGLDSPFDRIVKNGEVIDIIKNKGMVIKTGSDSL
ncbi:MAG: methionyl-tRNA formyltransferase, partial [Candidatus Omnitrophica bacterium]|nr:methionyl-tRNA formyltransferase [Candidatus Omnitrophota bacterium]